MEELDLPFDEIRERFLHVAMNLCGVFPELDLRFNLRVGTPNCRIFAGSLSRRILELDLSTPQLQQLIYEATWEIKRAAGITDA